MTPLRVVRLVAALASPTVALASLELATGLAWAAPPRGEPQGAKPAAPAPAPAAPSPALVPGKCISIQPQVKQCAVATVGGVGTFDVIVTPPAGLVITFEEPIVGMQPPPSSSYQAIFSGATATVVPLRKDPIAGATVHFDTASVHVTLNLRMGPVPDTQLLIVDPRKAVRDAEVERRVKEAMEGLEARANERAERILLEELAAGGADLADADVSPARRNQVVLRAGKRLRVGGRHFLVFSIDNRAGDDLEVKGVRVWVGKDGKETEVQEPLYQLAPTVHVAEEVPGAVSLPQGTIGGDDRLRLRVEMADPERTVEISGIRPR
jgi:hypothetical protein